MTELPATLAILNLQSIKSKVRHFSSRSLPQDAEMHFQRDRKSKAVNLIGSQGNAVAKPMQGWRDRNPERGDRKTKLEFRQVSIWLQPNPVPYSARPSRFRLYESIGLRGIRSNLC